jgi:predicted ferric reductase
VTLQVSNIQPFKVRAGQFFQLRMPGVSVWSLFQNHPFAVAWWDEDENGCATSLFFLVQVRSGFTAKLLQNASSNAAHLTWVDGPYGVPLDLRGYGCTLMFASGIGIAAQISYVKEILKQRGQWQSSVRNITLAWEIEDSSMPCSMGRRSFSNCDRSTRLGPQLDAGATQARSRWLCKFHH